MLKHNRSRNVNQQRIIGDLTSSQLVLAICIFLIAALLCFSLGVVVGKYEERSSQRDSMAAAKAQTARQAEQDQSGRGVQTSPRTIAAKNIPGYPESPESASPAVSARPRVSEMPAPPKRADTQDPQPQPKTAAPVETAQPPKETEPPAPPQPPQEKTEQRQTQEPEQVQTPAPAAKADPDPLEPVEKPDEETPPADPEPPAANQGIYTIQVAALSAPTRQQQALKLKSELEGLGLQPDILTTDDGKRLCVVVGSYQNRQEAQAACNDLRKTPRFADSFVRTR